MNEWSLFGLARTRFDSGDCNRVLCAARDYGFIRPESGATHEIGNQANLTNLTRETKHRSKFAPGFCVGETINEIGEAIDFEIPERVCRYVALHRNASGTTQHKESTHKQNQE